MILKQIIYQWINYVAGKINKTFFFKVRTVQLCINNNISNDGCKMSNYITQYENNVCMYIHLWDNKQYSELDYV